MNRETSKFKINVGSSTAIMIFLALCLVVISTLCIIEANNSMELAKKNAESVKNYYLADSLAIEVIESLMSGHPANINFDSYKMEEHNYISYSVNVDNQRQLNVLLKDSNGKLLIERWQVSNTTERQIDDSITVWDGEE